MKSEPVRLEISRPFLRSLLLLYCGLIFYLLFLSPLCGRVPRLRSVNLIPLGTLIPLMRYSPGPDLFVLNVVGNLGLFFPLGLLLFWLNRIPFKGTTRILFLGAALSLVVEGNQWLFRLGIFDVDDIFLNSLGFLFGVRLGAKLLFKKIYLDSL